MSNRIPDLLPKRLHIMTLGDVQQHKAAGTMGRLTPSLFFALLFAVALPSAAQVESSDAQDTGEKGWNLKQSVANETAAPPELDIESAREAQKDQPQIEQQPFIEPQAEALTEPQAEALTEPQAEALTEPQAEALTEPQAEALTEPQAEALTEPQTEIPSEGQAGSATSPDLRPSNEVTTPAAIPTTPVIDLSPELRDALKSQFQQVRKLLETEEAFSETLGEVYLSYGTLLQKAGRLEESRKMLVNALHIVKVNNGVNSIEQRPVLRALFEMNFARQNTQEMEDNLRRIIWLEKKVPEQDDDYSFDMIVRLGNHFLDQYLENPRVTEYNLANLKAATRYFRLAVNRYGNRPLDELFMPYGELAYSNFLKSRIEAEVSRSSFGQNTRQSSYSDLEKYSRSSSSLGGSFAISERYLREYLDKAVEENQNEHVVLALLSLGDLNILFGRRTGAMRYYEQAWDASQALPVSHPVVASFDAPQLLPAFNFSRARPETRASAETFSDSDEFELVPLKFDIDTDGNVKSVRKDATDGTTGWDLSRAKRIARKMKFRPMIENGKLIKSLGYQQEIKIKARSNKNTSPNANNS